jgi:peptide-methionine (R)-S-oxide reductase
VTPPPATSEIPPVGAKLELSDEEWRKRLTPEQFTIMRRKGTEPPFSGAYDQAKERGVYHCAGCNAPLFHADTKFDSKTGWPSFWQPIDFARLRFEDDFELSTPRVEVLCAHCGGHLGHVFKDGPRPTGERYCINSLALYLRPEAVKKP